MSYRHIAALQNELKQNEALLIQKQANRFYYTGFSSSAGLLLITKKHADYLIDFRYFEKAKSVIKGSNVILSDSPDRQIYELLKQYGIETLYLETSYTSIASLRHYGEVFPEIAISMEDTFDRMIEKQRSIKTAEEIAAMEKAQALTDETFNYILEHIRPGKTEREIMLEMEFYIRKRGSEGVSFDFIVVSGKNSSLPHGVPTDKEIENGDFITMDFGAVVEGYRSDMTRTVGVGKLSDEQVKVYNTVLEAQELAMRTIRPGMKGCEVDAAARDYIYNAGYKGCFGHGLGHSVGIEIHENPRFSPACNTPIEPGMVITVEPGIYLENRFGVRIEDMVLITENGYRNLTKSKKELIIL